MKIRKIEKSQMIAALAYKAGTLVVSFKRGGVYVYRNVPSWLYALLFRASSMGGAFRKHIRNNPAFACERLA